jgi:hypothetical protein
MPRTQGQLEEAAARAERLLDELDPQVLLDPATRVDDLREVGVALAEVATAQRHLTEAVAAARGNGRSWGEIGSVLGVSKQGARERFGRAGKQAPADEPSMVTVREPGRGDLIFVEPWPLVEPTAEQRSSGARTRPHSTSATGPGGTAATGPGAGLGKRIKVAKAPGKEKKSTPAE